MSNKEKRTKSRQNNQILHSGGLPKAELKEWIFSISLSTRRFMKKGASLNSPALCKPILIPNDHLFQVWMLTYLFSVHSKFCWEPMANPIVHHNPKMIPFLKLWIKITHHPVSLPFSSSPKKILTVNCICTFSLL